MCALKSRVIIQQRALWQVIEALQRGAAHESLVCCAAYLLGEYGRQVEEVPVRDQFNLLQERFVTVSSEAKVGCWHTCSPESISCCFSTATTDLCSVSKPNGCTKNSHN